ncbi:hypothetical protein [Cribrihabitans pelagius]|uniref:hypothetical protein n=1 Tax=Cribrihabitans pelagius TaxID=1765746 RepID=UPI003B5CCD97
MTKLLIGSAVALALASTSLSAAPLQAQGSIPGFGTAIGEQIWLAKGNNGKGHGDGHGGGKKKLPKKGHGNAGNGNPGNGNAHAGNGNDRASDGMGNGKPGHAGGPKPKAKGKDTGHASSGNGNGAHSRRAFTKAEREEAASRISSAPAPAGRDMTRVLGAAALALVTPQLIVSDIPEDELIVYRNCPPGLAKKDPPCVPPGLAKKGVTYDEWASNDQDRYESIWVERRNQWLSSEADTLADPDPGLLLLQSDQIATLFGLGPAPEGQRYALIDGMPVLLDEEDYNSLLLVNQMAQVPDLAAGVPVAPAAALTQDELVSLYRLPQPSADENYAVLNGQLVLLDDEGYELLQMLRIARAIL